MKREEVGLPGLATFTPLCAFCPILRTCCTFVYLFSATTATHHPLKSGGFFLNTSRPAPMKLPSTQGTQAVCCDPGHMPLFHSEDCLTLCLQVFLALGSNFTVQLVSAVLLSEPSYGLPTILQEAKSAILPIPEEAANSQVIGSECSSARQPQEGSTNRKTKVFKN